MKRLQRYYFHVGIPVLLIVLGTIIFFKEIMGTVQGNPHPQINYLIFILIAAGCVQMLLHVRRINREGELLRKFTDLVTVRQDLEAAKRLMVLEKSKQTNDVTDVLNLVLESHGDTVDALHHAAIESEIERFHARQNRRLLLAQFMSGMMVGLGLLGTFIGLLGALNEIGKLIGSFSLGPGMTDPIAAVSELVTRLTEPMKAMGIAFSASLFGVLGSLIMGMLMVFVKSATVELVSLVQSKVSWIVDLQPNNNAAEGADIAGVDQLQKALAGLAEQSPVLQGLVVALDQSERRVRQVLTGVQDLVAQVVQNTQSHANTNTLVGQVSEQQAAVVRTMQSIQGDMGQLNQATLRNSDSTQALAQAMSQQHNIQGQHWADMREQLATKQSGVLETLQSTQELLSLTLRQSQQDTQSRLEMAQQIKSAMQEQQDRHEQLLHTLSIQLNRLTTPKN